MGGFPNPQLKGGSQRRRESSGGNIAKESNSRRDEVGQKGRWTEKGSPEKNVNRRSNTRKRYQLKSSSQEVSVPQRSLRQKDEQPGEGNLPLQGPESNRNLLRLARKSPRDRHLVKGKTSKGRTEKEALAGLARATSVRPKEVQVSEGLSPNESSERSLRAGEHQVRDTVSDGKQSALE